MPYKKGNRLGGESASKLGHLEVINSELVNEIIDKFDNQADYSSYDVEIDWEALPDKDPLPIIFSVDGSLQTVRSDRPPFKELSFIKVALVNLDKNSMEKLDPISPHPFAMRDILKDSAIHHATVFPLKGMRFEDLNNYNAVRRIIYDSFSDPSLNGEVFKTLKWLAYRKWLKDESIRSPEFECPHCEIKIDGLSYNTEEDHCPHCNKTVYLTDMIGFHLDMVEDSASESISTSYMLIFETLLLFSGIKYFWDNQKYEALSKTLFLKDGPLTLRSQYSKLVIPIREFLEHARRLGKEVYIVGQEKSGKFTEYFDRIDKSVPPNSFKILNNKFIREEVQSRPERKEEYGYRTNYGNKVFAKIQENHRLVLSIPSGEYKDTSDITDLIGAKRILSTLPAILSYNHENALLPIVLANGVASLSSYPSAAILKLFAKI